MMEKAGVPTCPVMTAAEVWTDEEYNRMGWWNNFPMYPEWDGTDAVSNKQCAYFADFSAVSEEDRPARKAPHIGENSAEVFAEWCKDAAEGERLAAKWHKQK